LEAQQINRISFKVTTLLSLIALCAVISGYFQPPQRDEGAAAHIFQLSILFLVPAIIFFLATLDWKLPLLGVKRLAIPASALVLAFGSLFYLEHYR
jgi:hypothetical protein